MKYSPHYLILNQEEVHRLVANDAPKSVWAVYTCLCAFAGGKKKSCFPSYQTIKDWLKSKMHLDTIGRAVAKLVEYGVIEKNHKRSKERFVMRLRSIVQTAKGIINSNPIDPSGKTTPDRSVGRNNKERINNYKRKKSLFSPRHWFSLGETKEQMQKRKEGQPAETIFSKLVGLSPSMDPKVLAKKERETLYLGLKGKTNESEWLEWVQQEHKEKLPELIRVIGRVRESHDGF